MLERLGQRPKMPNGSLAAYSPMVRAGGFIFLSGQLPFDPDRRIVEGGIEAHVAQCYGNVRALLQTVNCDLADIVKTTNYLANPEDFAAFNQAYLNVFGDTLPARATVCAQLLMPAALEVDVIAYDRHSQ